MVLAEKTGCSGKSGVSCRADDNFVVAELCFKLFDYGFGRVYLSNADSMKPDTIFFGAPPADLTETLGPAGTITTMPDGAVYNDRTISQSGK